MLGILSSPASGRSAPALTTFALVPNRERVVVAKTLGATVLTLFAVAAPRRRGGGGREPVRPATGPRSRRLGTPPLFDFLIVMTGLAFGMR